MKKNGMSAKEKAGLLKRSYGLCHQLAPTYIMRKCAASVVSVIFSYAGIYLSGLIVDAITSGGNFETVLQAVILYIVLRTVFSDVICGLLVFPKHSQLENGFTANAKMLLAKKCANLDYTHIENPDTHRKKWEADNFLCGGASRWNGMGLLFYDTQKIFKPAAAILIGFCLSFKPLFLTPACAGGWIGFVQSVWALPLLALVYAAVLFFRQQKSVKAGKIWTDHFADKKVIQLGREYRFYADFFTYRYQRGKDVRIYDQQKLLLGEFHRINKLNDEYGRDNSELFTEQ